jgi:hypothetical protein
MVLHRGGAIELLANGSVVHGGDLQTVEAYLAEQPTPARAIKILGFAVHGIGNNYSSWGWVGCVSVPTLGVIVKFARHDIAKLVGTAIAVAALGLTIPGSAAADDPEDAFVRKVAAHGLDLGSGGEDILLGEKVCAAFSGGMSPARVQATMLNHDSARTPRQTALFMTDAVQAFCPRYADLFIS